MDIPTVIHWTRVWLRRLLAWLAPATTNVAAVDVDHRVLYAPFLIPSVCRRFDTFIALRARALPPSPAPTRVRDTADILRAGRPFAGRTPPVTGYLAADSFLTPPSPAYHHLLLPYLTILVGSVLFCLLT